MTDGLFDTQSGQLPTQPIVKLADGRRFQVPVTALNCSRLNSNDLSVWPDLIPPWWVKCDHRGSAKSARMRQLCGPFVGLTVLEEQAQLFRPLSWMIYSGIGQSIQATAVSLRRVNH